MGILQFKRGHGNPNPVLSAVNISELYYDVDDKILWQSDGNVWNTVLNTFSGNQTVSGTLVISSSGGLALQVSGNTELIGNIYLSGSITSSRGLYINNSTTGLITSSFTAHVETIQTGSVDVVGITSHFSTSSDGPALAFGVRFNNNNQLTVARIRGISSPGGNSQGDLIFETKQSIFCCGTGLATTEVMRLNRDGNVVIGKTTANSRFDVNGNVTVTGSLIMSGSTIPQSVSSSGIVGQFAFNNNFFYICTGSNAWMRISSSNIW